MAAVDVQFLGVSDDGPVGGCWLVEDAELDEGAKLTDHLQSLIHASGVAACLDIDVAAIAVRQVPNAGYGIRVRHVDRLGRAELQGEFEPVLLCVEGDELAPASSVDHLAAKAVAAPRTRRHYSCEVAGAAKLGHYAWVYTSGVLADWITSWAAAATGTTRPGSAGADVR